ncbi:MAG TPA: precorrin-3B C(17)-methyltransferase [Candidatus Copromorpha excrementigallinarum]|uniref:Precorrin-3B C(17)-methyltransferase n=1 Tax=Candidatus Allocopromorpha excrementigallinarum TaxID=2840742 RepID=A0A9D1L737_9FIRM|nr:precorrin-3B C(17)-methyltransferase [Candidatus Copromorpha excrementigallinarum]
MNSDHKEETEMKIYVVGIGPGRYDEMTGRAEKALLESDVIIGYKVYIQLIRDRFSHKEMIESPMRGEEARCDMAVEEALKGRTVSVVCGGDPGVYGMAGLVCGKAGKYEGLQVEVVPGITAACSGAAVLGAPLIHDFAVISLSDLLTPWETIEKRLKAAAETDMVICLYNPASRRRRDHLKRACEIVMKYRSPGAVCGLAVNVGRDGEEGRVMTLGQLAETEADMFTTVFIGNSRTRNIGEKMVTPRGYSDEDIVI